jgi:hypothetical protein
LGELKVKGAKVRSEEGWPRAGEKQNRLQGKVKECFEDFNKK